MTLFKVPRGQKFRQFEAPGALYLTDENTADLSTSCVRLHTDSFYYSDRKEPIHSCLRSFASRAIYCTGMANEKCTSKRLRQSSNDLGENSFSGSLIMNVSELSRAANKMFLWLNENNKIILLVYNKRFAFQER